MSRKPYRVRVFSGWLVTILLLTSCDKALASQREESHISVADTIPLTTWVNERYFGGGDGDAPVAVFSPDQTQFVILVNKGNAERNTNDYSILWFKTSEALAAPKARILLTVSSSTNRPAIRGLRWLTDESLVFLGTQQDGMIPQVVRYTLSSNRLEVLTDSPTPVEAFAVSDNGSEIVFEADPAKSLRLDANEVQQHGLVVSNEDPLNVLAGEASADQGDNSANRELFAQRVGQTAKKIACDDFISESLPVVLSPSGRYAVIVVYVRDLPRSWFAYQDELLRPYLVERRKPGSLSNVNQYLLLDTVSARLEPLFDAPKPWFNTGVAWPQDERSVMLSGTYLPLAVEDQREREDRQKHAFVVEVRLSDRKITKITDANLAIAGWDQDSRRLVLKPQFFWTKSTPEAYEKQGSDWQQVPLKTSDLKDSVPMSVTLEEDINHPPKIFAARPASKDKTLLFDLNPQLANFDLGKVEAIAWKARDGHEVQGGLYLPPNYTPGHRYPLVIQTHGFRADRFRINGPWNSAFAAQPLAANDIVVLQVGNATDPTEDLKYVNTPQESPRQMGVYESAIDELDRRGLIDRDHVGIIGFSRTVLHVVYTLTHSDYRFEAATLADGFDGGYVGYMLWGGADYVAVNGGFPSGAGMKSWLENSAGFNLDKIRVPVRLEYYGRWGALGGWALYSGLSLLNKPVDFVWLPFGAHMLVRPCDRLVSQQGDVDWFRFWLEGREDPSEARKEQFARWNHLKTLQSHQDSEVP